MSEELTSLLIALSIIVAAIFLSWLSGKLLRQLTKRVLSKTATSLDDMLVNTVRSPLRLLIVVIGSEIALRQISLIPEQWQDPLGHVFFVVYVALIYYTVSKLIGGTAEWYGKEVAIKTETDLDDKFLAFFRTMANVLVAVITIVMLLGRFGIELSALVTTMGIGTLAVALAAQETLSDIISGFMIMLDQPFAVGDRVAILDIDTWGDVTEVGLRSTRILTRDNRLVSIPNSVIGKGLVVNYSNPSTVYRVQTHVGIAYGTDLDKARKIMIDAIRAEDWVMQSRPVEALMLEFRDSALHFRVRCWIENYVETRRVMDKMNSALYRALNREGIVMPMPQREVQLVSPGILPEKLAKTE